MAATHEKDRIAGMAGVGGWPQPVIDLQRAQPSHQRLPAPIEVRQGGAQIHVQQAVRVVNSSGSYDDDRRMVFPQVISSSRDAHIGSMTARWQACSCADHFPGRGRRLRSWVAPTPSSSGDQRRAPGGDCRGDFFWTGHDFGAGRGRAALLPATGGSPRCDRLWATIWGWSSAPAASPAGSIPIHQLDACRWMLRLLSHGRRSLSPVGGPCRPAIEGGVLGQINVIAGRLGHKDLRVAVAHLAAKRAGARQETRRRGW